MEVMENKKGIFSKIRFKERIKYLLNDRIAVAVFILMFIKDQLFINVLQSSKASKLTTHIDMYAVLNSYVYILFTIIIISLTFLLKKRAHLWSLVILNILFSILIIGDLWCYRGFSAFLSLHTLSETGNLNNVSEGIMSLARPVDIFFVIDNIFVIIAAIRMSKRYQAMEKFKGTAGILFVVPFILILFFHVVFDFHGNGYEGPMLFKTQWIPFSTMRNLSPIGYHVYDASMFIEDNMPYSLSKKDKNEIRNWLAYKNENLPDNQYKGIFKGKNLIIIQVESLENFILNHSYNGQEITPNLNKLLKNSIYFSNYNEQVYDGTSSDSDLMTNASVYPIRRGSTFFRFPNNKYNTLARLFKKENYTTRAFHADYGYYWNVENALTNFGFDKFRGMETYPKKDVYMMGLTDKSFLTQTAGMVMKTPQPFYSFQVTTTSHMPFKMRKDMKTMKIPADFGKTYMGRYYQSFHYADAQIGNFINILNKNGLLKNTVVAIYGDHTSLHKYYGDEITKMRPYKKWWDNGYRIPLILYSKGMKPEQVKTIGGQIDIMPTLCYTFGIDSKEYENTTMGRNLLNTKKSFALLANGTILGADKLSKKDIEHIKQSFDVADKIIRTDYFYHINLH
ncbi:LTA synthase family protein [Clostridium oryzae]|uniref:Lipoteichoic acid synthase 2 n=1 Tax=Clostridium oryzae TaxID=1450648 RepID=A0A1V4IP08_9CLOT|nr:LTA synthase family protein [Clostridium oryzae]OPJ61207.1 lipoteichoic acid synthase 2 [Clostridium oryzae]